MIISKAVVEFMTWMSNNMPHKTMDEFDYPIPLSKSNLIANNNNYIMTGWFYQMPLTYPGLALDSVR